MSDETKPLVVVAGATGYLGGHVVRALHARGCRIRALARDPSRLGELRPLCDEVFVGHATRPETLEGLCDGADVVFSSVGIRSFGRKPTVWQVDRDANLNILTRAREAGVGHFIFVSAVNAELFVQRGVSVARAREAVVDALKVSGPRWTVLRPTGFFNDMADMFKMARKGTGWVVGDGSCRMNPIHGADLAEQAARAITDEACWDAALDLGGPDTFTFRGIQELAFLSVGAEPKIRRVAPWMVDVVRWLIRPFNGNAAGFLHALRYMATTDMLGEPVGENHLADFYAELAEGEGRPDKLVCS